MIICERELLYLQASFVDSFPPFAIIVLIHNVNHLAHIDVSRGRMVKLRGIDRPETDEDPRLSHLGP